MEDSLGVTIEKIKLQAQDKEAKLKEKREHEATMTSYNRMLRETVSQIEKLNKEIEELNEKIDNICVVLAMEKIKYEALKLEVEHYRKELNELESLCERGIAEVWKLRSSLCEKVQKASDVWDIRALLMKPLHPEAVNHDTKSTNLLEEYDQQIVANEQKITSLRGELSKALAKRDRLQSEPDVEDEFIRIKKALKYSMNIVENLQKK